jgi:hypothetical protein
MFLLRDPPALAAEVALQVRALTRSEVPVVVAGLAPIRRS